MASPALPVRAFLNVVINGSSVGETLVTLDGSDARLEAGRLEAWGIRARVPVDHPAGGPPEVSLNRLRGHLDYQVDDRNLVLRLEVAPELFDPSFISLAPGRPMGLVQRWDTSAFLNWALRVDTHGTTTLDLEHGTRFGRALLEGSVNVGAGRTPTRGLTHVLFDDPEHALRWTFGDAIERPGDLGGNLVLGGLVVAREPSLTPYLPRTPGLTFAGQATTPSTVEVYVDGVLDRRIPVAPGVFRIADIPAPRGNGVATYVLRDAFGNEQRFARPYQIGRGLLAPGLDDLAVGVGFERASLGTESFDYGRPVAFARRRIGLSERVTFGWRAETAPFARLANAGTSLALALPVGQLDLGVGASLDEGQGGIATFVGYELLSHSFGGTLYGVAKSDHYATLDLGRDETRTRLELGTALSVSGERWSTSLDVRARFPSPSSRVTPDGGATGSTGSSLLDEGNTRPLLEARLATSIQLARGVDLRVQGAVLTDEVAGESYSLGVVASFTPSAAVSVSALGELGPDGPRGHLLANLPMNSEVGLGARVSASLEEDPQLYAQLQGRGTLGQAAVDLRGSTERGWTGTLELDSSFAWVDGGAVHVTRPIREAWAEVEVPDDFPVEVLRENRTVTRQRGGSVVVGDLLPYDVNRVEIGARDLPLDVEVTDVERSVTPPYRGGARLGFGLQRARYVRGTLVAPDPETSLAGGEVRVEVGEQVETSPIGVDGAFELHGLAKGTFKGEAVSGLHRCALTLQVPENAKPIQDLGKIPCIPLASPEPAP